MIPDPLSSARLDRALHEARGGEAPPLPPDFSDQIMGRIAAGEGAAGSAAPPKLGALLAVAAAVALVSSGVAALVAGRHDRLPDLTLFRADAASLNAVSPR